MCKGDSQQQVAYAVLIYVYVDFLILSGFFVHQWNVSFRHAIPIAKVRNPRSQHSRYRNINLILYQILTFYLTIAYSAFLLFAKTAILIEWVKIFSPFRAHHGFFWACYVLIASNILLYTASIISSAITCIPHETLWYPWVTGKCIDRKALGLFTAFFNVIVDLLILLLPQNIIWRLQMAQTRKIGISIIFSFGILATVCAAGRVAATFDIEYHGDATYTISPLLLWAIPEVTCVLVVFCLPAIPKAFAQQGLLFNTWEYIRSWTRLSSQRAIKTPPSAKTNHPWPPTIGEIPSSNVHQRMDDLLRTTTSVTEQELMHTRSGDSQERISHDLTPSSAERSEPRQAQIVRTTEVEQRKDAASSDTTDGLKERQHPWMG